MFKHKVIDTITAISALILGVALTASSALAMRAPDPAAVAGGVGYTQPGGPPLPQTAVAASESTLNPSLIALMAVIAVIAVIAVVAAIALATTLTQATSRRHRTTTA